MKFLANPIPYTCVHIIYTYYIIIYIYYIKYITLIILR